MNRTRKSFLRSKSRPFPLYGKKLWRIFGLLILLSLNFKALARELKLGLSQAIELALVNNPELRIQKLDLEIARISIEQVKANYDPYFQASVNNSSAQRPSSQPIFGTESNSLSVNFSTGVSTPSGGSVSLDWRNLTQESNSPFMTLNPSYSSDLGLNFYQPLLKNGLRDWRKLDVKRKQNDYQQAELNLKSKALEITSRVEDAYWSLVRAKMDYELNQKSLDRAQKTLELTQTKVRTGLSPEVALLQSQANLESIRVNLLRSESELARAENALKQLLYFESEEELLSTELIPTDQPLAQEYEFSREEFLDNALDSNFMVQGLKLNLENQRLANLRSKNQLYPELNLSAGLSLSGLAGDSEPTTQTVPTGFVIPNPYPTPHPYILETTTITTAESEWEGTYWDAVNRMLSGDYLSWQAGLTFKLPFGNRSAKSQWKTAQYNYEKATLELERQSRLLRFNLESLLKDLDTAYRAWQTAQLARELAEKSYQIESRKFELGLSTQYQLLDQEQQLREAEKNEISALIEYNKSLARIKRAEQGYLEAQAVSAINLSGLNIPSITTGGVSGLGGLPFNLSNLPSGVDLNMLKSLGINLP